jgi:hypothetical protein
MNSELQSTVAQLVSGTQPTAIRVACSGGQYDDARRASVTVRAPGFTEPVNGVMLNGELAGIVKLGGWHNVTRHVELHEPDSTPIDLRQNRGFGREPIMEVSHCDAALWMAGDPADFDFVLGGPGNGNIIATRKE